MTRSEKTRQIAAHRMAFVAMFALSIAIRPAAGSPDHTIEFNRDIRPILSDNCYACHGFDQNTRKAGLRLDLPAGATAKLKNGNFAIVPGKPDQSELVARIFTNDPNTIMPPPEAHKSLEADEKELLKRWIEQGAAYQEHWAYVDPVKRPDPKVKDGKWPRNWIDRFVLARLEREGVAPSDEADRVTLIRRLYFDLIGLPPTPEQVRAFVNDKRPGAYERVVDELLASPHYGERLAIYWLDLVRYADTVGYHGDQTHNASPYRDYVIRSLNDNKRFDRFTREQLAGDILAKRDGGMLTEKQVVELKVASAYNRLLQTSHEGGVQPKEYLAIYAADRIRNVSEVWMGATIGCAQCHDHKFDPYTMKDFYSLVAFFADIDEAKHFKNGTNSLPTRRDPELQIIDDDKLAIIKEREQRIAANEAEIKRLGTKKETKAAADKLRGEIDKLKKDVATLRKRYARYCMITDQVPPREIRLLPRGNWLDDSGPVMQPAVPAFLPQIQKVGRADRLDLANWLVDTTSGVGEMTARNFVNRLWYLYLGTGISKGLDDLGAQGSPPVDIALLDRLSIEFVESGWDIKHIVRLIVTSSTYRQSSLATPEDRDRDPYNQLFARQARYRLPAEIVRDNALSISGLLVDELGGQSVKPYQPAGYYAHLNFPQRKYSHHNDQRQWRRGVYVHWQRQFLHPMLKAFDAPTREECTAERPKSNTPLASLALLNDPSFVEFARKFAERIINEGGKTDSERLAWAFELATSRKPSGAEIAVLRQLLEKHRAQYKGDPNAAIALLETGIAPVGEDVNKPELAAWTSVARTILNLNETMTRN